MRCPFCNYPDTGVIESRTMENELVVRRRRYCKKCQKRFTTHERIELIPLVVIKKDERRESFNRDKVIRGILRACEKRPISMAQMEQIVEQIEEKLKQSSSNEIKTQVIGQMVMNRLKKLDEVAYVRFASVYRHFKDVGSFLKEIDRIKMLKQKNERGKYGGENQKERRSSGSF
ncbi:MAG: transcriptional regulator NrdR [Atribacterota bacterium]|nr:transcriptional regulator NrdR [Atribacterota bacterium]MDD4896490.1 transcriptional regulator NrdR [Atribacterota bacterium]MDD5637220.1 transcriptional regulator NrdR [Atribacterota bacterium]